MCIAQAQPKCRFRLGPPPKMLHGLTAVLFLATTLLGGAAGAQTIVLELRQGAFDDARVKKAVMLSANWPRLAELAGLRPDGVLLRDGRRESEVRASRPDIDGARRLLAEAGYPGRPPLQHLILYEAPLEKLALAVAGTLKDIGLAGQLQLVSPQTREKILAATRYVTGQRTIELPYLLLTQEKRAAAPPPRVADLAVIGQPAADFEADSRTLTLSIAIANLGSAPAGLHLLVFFEQNGALEFPPVAVDGLGPRESRSFKTGLRVPEKMLGREIVVIAMVDAEKAVRESEEGNNRSDPLVVALPAAPRLADLVVRGSPQAAFDPDSRELVVTVAVANLGTAAAGPHRLALIDRSGTIEFPPFEIAQLPARESLRFQTTIPLPEAVLGRELVLQAEIDPAAAVRESDEDNNWSETLVFPLPQPLRHVDLVVAGAPSVAFDPQSRDLTLGLTVANLGNAPAGTHRIAVIDRSGTLDFPLLTGDPLGPGEERSLRRSLRIPEAALGRTLLLVAEVDSEAEVPESEEGNNRSEERRFTLPAPPPLPDFRPQRKPERRPDLAVDRQPAVTFDAQSRRLSLAVTVGNQGRMEAPASRVIVTEAAGALDFPPLATPILQPGATVRLAVAAVAPAGSLGTTLRLQANVDPDNRIEEADETNNSSAVVSYPLPAPAQETPRHADLTITSLHISHQAAGTLALVSLTVTNNGTAPSPPTVVELRAPSEGAMERIPVPELAAGESWQADWTVALGSAVFGRDTSVAAFVDPDDVVAETLETNNRSRQSLAAAIPARTWIIGAGLAAAVLLVTVWLLRARPPRRKLSAPAVRLSYRAQPDAGAQELLRRGEEPAVAFRLALRARSDPGTQNVSLGEA